MGRGYRMLEMLMKWEIHPDPSRQKTQFSKFSSERMEGDVREYRESRLTTHL